MEALINNLLATHARFPRVAGGSFLYGFIKRTATVLYEAKILTRRSVAVNEPFRTADRWQCPVLVTDRPTLVLSLSLPPGSTIKGAQLWL